MGIGLAAVGRPAYITGGRAHDLGSDRPVEAMRARTFEVLDAAYASGIRYIDAARSYGRSEEFLADWLAAHPDNGDVEIGSKWGYRYVGEWRTHADVHEIKEHSLTAFRRQLDESRSLLGDRLDLYQVHSVTPDSPVLTDLELQRALGELRDAGIRVGLSTSGPRQSDVLRAVLDIEVAGSRLFSSVQSTWNLLETSAGPALSEARAVGVDVILKEVFANGRLAPGNPDASSGAVQAEQIAAELAVGVDQLAVAAALHHASRPRVLSGAATAEQVRSHVAATDVDLTPTVLDALTAVAEDPDDYWATRSRRAWN